MARPPGREITLLQQTTITANGNGTAIPIPPEYWGCLLYLSTAAPTGTSPTLDIYIQQGFRAIGSSDINNRDVVATQPTIWDDYLHFPQVTTVATTQVAVARILAEIGTSASNSPTAAITAASSGALSGTTVNAGPFGMWWRVLWKVGGTSPSFTTVSIVGQFVLAQG